MKEVVPIHKAALENLHREHECDGETKTRQLPQERTSNQTSHPAHIDVFDKHVLPNPCTILLPQTGGAVLGAVHLIRRV